MSCSAECAICFDEIDIHVNCITTECNHRFHSRCFLTNASRNGFGCPMCRSELVEEIEDSDSEASYDDDDDDEDDDATVVQPLSGFRWLFQRAEGEPIPDDDEDDFTESETLYDEEELNWKRDDRLGYSITEITEKLVEKQVSMRDIVAFFVKPHIDQLADCDEFNADFMLKVAKIIDPMM